MERQELYVIEHVIQKDYKNLQGKSAIIIQGNDGNGQQFPLWKFEEGDFLDIPFQDTYNKKKAKRLPFRRLFV